jgi:hypothetical protein
MTPTQHAGTCPFCKTELNEHPVSRCLDAWVAKCRGWTNIVVHYRYAGGIPPRGNPTACVRTPIPTYSTDNGLAVGLLEEMPPDVRYRLQEYGTTPAHAICKAVIAWKEQP